jgi:hypothetical protein
MKVNKGQDKGRPTVPHPKPMGGSALRDGLEHLREHHKEVRKEKPMRPEHRRKEG